MGSFIRSTIFTYIPYFGLNECLEQEPKRRFVAYLLHSVLMNSGRTGWIFFSTAQVSALPRRRRSPQFSTPSSARLTAISALPRRLNRCLAPPVLQPGLHLVENCKMSRIWKLANWIHFVKGTTKPALRAKKMTFHNSGLIFWSNSLPQVLQPRVSRESPLFVSQVWVFIAGRFPGFFPL